MPIESYEHTHTQNNTMKRLTKLGRKSKSNSDSLADHENNHLGIGSKPTGNNGGQHKNGGPGYSDTGGPESLFNSQTSISSIASSMDDEDEGFNKPKQGIFLGHRGERLIRSRRR